MELSTQCHSSDYGLTWFHHESTDDPPKILAITGIVPKRERSSLADVISSAASTFAQAFKPQVSVSAANTSMVVNNTTPPKAVSP